MIVGRTWCAAVAGALMAMSAISSASAEVRIQRDFGGQIGPYLYKYAMVREAGQRVVIDGPCLSACTLALAVIPRERICMTPNAVLGFHAAWMPGADGRPVKSAGGTRLLMAVYPPKVRDWIRRRGGLNGKIMLLRGRELAALYPSCS
jgi:hypothetical protein